MKVHVSHTIYTSPRAFTYEIETHEETYIFITIQYPLYRL